MTAPFELKMTEQEAFDGLKKQFGTEFTTPEVRAFCAMNDIAYATVTRKIAQSKLVKVSGILQLLRKMSRTSRNHLVLHQWNLQQQETLS